MPLFSDPLSDAWLLEVSCTSFKSRQFRSIPTEGRQDHVLASAFEKLGIGKARATFVLDQKAETKRVDFEFREAVKRVKPGQTLIVFYSGHGYFQKGKLFFATWNAMIADDGWRMSRAAEQIKRSFRGKEVVWIVDACASGALRSVMEGAKTHVTVLSTAKGREDVPEDWKLQETLVGALPNFAGDWKSLAEKSGWNWWSSAVPSGTK